MEVEGTDFDPTTEEGQVDINDEEYESLLPDDNVNSRGLFDKLRRKYGSRARDALRSLGRKWSSRNPGKSLPEYMRMEDLGPIPEAPSAEWLQKVQREMDESMEETPDDFDRLQELLPDWDPKKAQLMFEEDEYGREVIMGRLARSGAKVYVIRNEKGRFFADPKIPPTLKEAIGRTTDDKLLADIRKRYPKASSTLLEFQRGNKGQIQVRYVGRERWYDFYQSKKSNALNNALPKEITTALGRPDLSVLSSLTSKETSRLASQFFKGLSSPKATSQMRAISGILDKDQGKLAKIRATKENIEEKLTSTPSGSSAALQLQQSLESLDMEEKTQQELINKHREQLDELTEQLDEKTAELEAAAEHVEYLKQTMDEREEEYMKQYQTMSDSHERESEDNKQRISMLLHERDKARRNFDRAVADVGDRDAELRRVGAQLEASVMKERELNAQIVVTEEQLRQATQAYEDMEAQLERQQEAAADQGRTEGEREAAQAEAEALQERLTELRAQRDGQ
ncbi:citron Rho-interacting kinase-like [Actinia tenebrosa]|uniref:Citron Rho-interacting kinase-like n=1 Tax=Actinia tenebrosa TaxID=6105 RepID=A0A6P8H4R6_ACTTE|nr:citron Rho-interacting kinase-like [Actinia tenebrosa]